MPRFIDTFPKEMPFTVKDVEQRFIPSSRNVINFKLTPEWCKQNLIQPWGTKSKAFFRSTQAMYKFLCLVLASFISIMSSNK